MAAAGTAETARTAPAWRAAGAAAAAVAAAAHIAALEHHVREAPALAAGFALFTVACLAAAVGLLVSGTARTWMASAGICGGALATYALSRTLGLPGTSHHSHVGSWTDPLGLVSMAGESAMILLAAGALLSLRPRPAQLAAVRVGASRPAGASRR